MDIGGLVGANAGTITNCYAANSVIGNQNTGGLAGSNYSGSYSSSFWNDEVNTGITGLGNSVDPVGVMSRNTSQMWTQSTFIIFGWDFAGEDDNGTDNVWRMCSDGIGYPGLTWEFDMAGDFLCPNGVAIEDLEYLAERWLMTETKADLNSDGSVDMLDYVILAQNWIQGS